MNPTKKDATYTSRCTSHVEGTECSSYAYPHIAVTEGAWAEWTISLDQLKSLYSDGATKLVFAMVSSAGASYNLDTPAETYLDYIRYAGN